MATQVCKSVGGVACWLLGSLSCDFLGAGYCTKRGTFRLHHHISWTRTAVPPPVKVIVAIIFAPVALAILINPLEMAGRFPEYLVSVVISHHESSGCLLLVCGGRTSLGSTNIIGR